MTINRKNKGGSGGFTLIEMLVVIAVVGILSAVVLTALGPARNKAKDSRIISGLNQARAVAETVYDGDYGAVTSGKVPSNDPALGKLAADISANQGELNIIKDSSELSYSAYSKLASDSKKIYCVDSSGNAGEIAAAPTTSVCQ